MILHCCLLVLAAVFGQATSNIAPRGAEQAVGGEVSIECNTDTDTPVTNCIFRVWLNGEDTQPMDLAKGKDGREFTRTNARNEPLFVGVYDGAGLDRGECSVKLSKLTAGRYFVGCRVRSAGRGWSYDYMALAVQRDLENYRVTTADDVDHVTNFTVDAGADSPEMTFVDSAVSPTECRVHLPGLTEHIVVPGTPVKTDAIHATLAGSRCHVTLVNVKKRGSGIVWVTCKVGDKWRTFQPQIVNVKVPPKSPQLEVPATEIEAGTQLEATCRAQDARPAARLRWQLDGVTQRDDAVDDSDDAGEWAWPWDVQSASQTFKHLVPHATGNVTLSCQVLYPDRNTVIFAPAKTVMVTPATTTPTSSTTPGASSPQSTKTPHGSDSPTPGSDAEVEADDPGDAGLAGWLVACIVLLVLVVAGGLLYVLLVVLAARDCCGPALKNKTRPSYECLESSFAPCCGQGSNKRWVSTSRTSATSPGGGDPLAANKDEEMSLAQGGKRPASSADRENRRPSNN